MPLQSRRFKTGSQNARRSPLLACTLWPFGIPRQTGTGRSSQSLCLALSLACAVQLGSAHADSTPFWGAKTSVAIDTPIDQLKQGEFLWMGDAFTSGPVVMVVSLTEQKAYLYRNRILIGATTVSTGRPGHVTPTGVFTVLQKQKEHRSTIMVAGDAPLAAHALVLTEGPSGIPNPYVPDPSRFRWSRIGVPGHLAEAGTNADPATIARIKIPAEFVSQLNSVLTTGATLFVTDEALSAETSGTMVQVVDANPPSKHR
jgi:hypothetical protein